MSYVAVVGVWLFATGTATADDLTLQEMLRELRWKDARFDNASVVITTRKTVHRDPIREWGEASFNAMKFGQEAPPKPEPTEPFDVEFVQDRQLTIRGDETTIETRSEQYGNGDPIGHVFRSRSSDATEVVRSMPVSKEEHRTLWIRPIEENGLFYESKREIQFSCGIGFGERMRSVSQVEPHEDGWNVEGMLVLWGDDTTKAILDVDRDYLVREAKLISRNENGEWVTEVRTAGLAEAPSGYRIAASAEYRIRVTESIRDGVATPVDRVRSEFSSDKHRLIWELTDAKYRDLVFIDESLAEHVRDYRKRKANR